SHERKGTFKVIQHRLCNRTRCESRFRIGARRPLKPGRITAVGRIQGERAKAHHGPIRVSRLMNRYRLSGPAHAASRQTTLRGQPAALAAAAIGGLASHSIADGNHRRKAWVTRLKE